MAVFVPGTGVAPADLFEDLSRDVVEQYRAAEARILRQIQRRIDRQLDAPGETDPRLSEQLAQVRSAIRSIDTATARLGIDPGLADNAIATAVAEGSAAAADRLGLVNVFPASGPLTSTSASATVQVALDLRSRLDDVKLRILRYEEDAYQRIVAKSLPDVLLGTTYSIDRQKQTVAEWLSTGIPGFVDKSGRQWSTGAYVEMATRTGLARAYHEASVYRQQQAGLELVTIVVGASADKSCAQWIGKVLSTNGGAGTYTLPHSTTGETIEVVVADSVAHARSTSHLFGPNCRCISVAYSPGLDLPVGATTYDPEKEAARYRQRELERRLRRDKTRLTLSPNEDDQAGYRARIRETQAELRAHIREHDLPRKAYREQPQWAGGSTPGRAGTPPRPETPPPAPAPTSAPAPLRDTIARMSSGEAAAAAQARHGIPFESWEGVTQSVGVEAISQLSDLLDRFPRARFERIAGARGEGQRLPARTMAYVITDKGSTVGSLHIVRAMLSEKRLTEAATRNTVDRHMLSGGGSWQAMLRHTVTHEFVHGVDNNIGKGLSKMYRREYAAATKGMEYAEAYAWRTENVGKYARTNDAEGVAETITTALELGDAATPFQRTILEKALELLDKEL